MTRFRICLGDDRKAYYYFENKMPTVPDMQDTANLNGFKGRTLGVIEEWDGHKYSHVKTEVVRYA